MWRLTQAAAKKYLKMTTKRIGVSLKREATDLPLSSGTFTNDVSVQNTFIYDTIMFWEKKVLVWNSTFFLSQIIELSQLAPAGASLQHNWQTGAADHREK